MKMRFTLLALAALMLSACSSSPYKIDFDYDRSALFGNYRTWSWMSEHPMIVTDSVPGMSPLWEGRIMTHVEEEMAARGFRKVDNPEAADMAISFTIGARDKIKVNSYPVSYHASYGRGWGYGGRGGYYGMNYGTETNVRQYTEGQLAIDIFDVKQRKPVWHGFATGNVKEKRDQAEREALIDEVVRKILLNFPPA